MAFNLTIDIGNTRSKFGLFEERELIHSISQKAMDLEYDGLMIETHPTPDEAWSDAKQQITPETLIIMLENIVMRNRASQNPESEALLDVYRGEINNIDSQILEILGKRMQVAEKIGELKKQNNITILQSERWKKVKAERLAFGLQHGLTEKFLKRYLDALHQESIRQQTRVMN